jgi:DNA uptake protein ComE-like DNA-binding protein
MNKVKDYFDFSSTQLRIIALLSALALGLSGYLLIHSLAEPVPETTSPAVYIGDAANDYTGLFVVDLNLSPADSLELLPGIGKVLADRIVAYRQHQEFTSEMEITRVRGIGPKMYERLRPYLKVRKK